MRTLQKPPVGPHLRRLREAKGWSPEELAERAGVHPQTVRKIEDGQRQNPRFRIMADLARALGVSLDDFAA